MVTTENKVSLLVNIDLNFIRTIYLMKTILILFVIILASCSKSENFVPDKNGKKRIPIELVTDSTTDNGYQHD
jgi:hypothetical protein